MTKTKTKTARILPTGDSPAWKLYSVAQALDDGKAIAQIAQVARSKGAYQVDGLGCVVPMSPSSIAKFLADLRDFVHRCGIYAPYNADDLCYPYCSPDGDPYPAPLYGIGWPSDDMPDFGDTQRRQASRDSSQSPVERNAEIVRFIQQQKDEGRPNYIALAAEKFELGDSTIRKIWSHSKGSARSSFPAVPPAPASRRRTRS